MPSALEWDLLVVGAGPAGSCAAAAAASRGVHTVLIDAKTGIGERPHCGEFVPRRLFVEWDLPKAAIIQPVEMMETWITDLDGRGDVAARSEISSPGLLIDRIRFDRELAREASAAGATVMSSARLMRKEEDTWIVRCAQEEMRIRPKFVIAADGALSKVASALGLKRLDCLTGVQAEVPLLRPQDRTFVFLCRDFVGGYGWLFPKGKVANVGLGVVPLHGIAPRALLERLLDWLRVRGMIREGWLSRTAGTIAVSGLREELITDNVVFCGDAAGLTHPITGAGIPQAVFSGYQAGTAAAATLKMGNRDSLFAYEQEIRGRYQAIIAHASSKRKIMMSSWADPDFENICRQTWIGFKQYRRRVR